MRGRDLASSSHEGSCRVVGIVSVFIGTCVTSGWLHVLRLISWVILLGA